MGALNRFIPVLFLLNPRNNPIGEWRAQNINHNFKKRAHKKSIDQNAERQGLIKRPKKENKGIEALEGIKRLYQEGMIYLKLCAPKDRMIRAITSGLDLTKIIPDFENFWVKKRIRLKIPVRILAPIDSQAMQTMTPSVEQLRSVKYFNDRNFPYKIGIEIFANGMVGVFSVSKPLRGIVIKDKIMAQSFRCLFELLWDNIPTGEL